MRMKTQDDDTISPRGRNFLRLWREVAQGTFPFMREETGGPHAKTPASALGAPISANGSSDDKRGHP